MTTHELRKIRLEKIADKATRWIGSTTSLIVHSIAFIVAFVLPLVHLISFEEMLLVLTTIVSLEAIYLSIFIQMSVNKNSQDIEIIQEDVGEIQEDIDEIQKDVDEIQEDIEDMEDEEGVIDDSVIEKKEADALAAIQSILLKLQKDIDLLKHK
jgi:low affinity Fe/Cu permease